jgi:hypothetical protein
LAATFPAYLSRDVTTAGFLRDKLAAVTKTASDLMIAGKIDLQQVLPGLRNFMLNMALWDRAWLV